MSDINKYSKQMLAVFLDKNGKLVSKKTNTPAPGPGEVLIRMAAAPVNPSDLARINKALHDPDPDEFIPGLEGSGQVVASGGGILPAILLGKRVACSSKYRTSGTWAEYMITPAGMCFPLSSKVSDEQGSMALVNPLTALAFIEMIRGGKHKAFINNAAASALGRMLEMLARKHNIPVINIVRKEEHVENLKKSGSAFVLNSTSPLFISDLGILSEKLRATIFFDTVCNSQLPEIAGILPAGSSIVIYGNRSGAENIMINPGSLMDTDIKISGFFLGYHAKKSGFINNILNLRKVNHLMSSELKIKIRNRFPLERAQEAVDTYLENMSEGKILLIPGYPEA